MFDDFKELLSAFNAHRVSGVDFDRSWEKRVEAVIDPATGLTANFLSREDLITAKLAAGRPQDIADAAALRKGIAPQEPPAPQKRQRKPKP